MRKGLWSKVFLLVLAACGTNAVTAEPLVGDATGDEISVMTFNAFNCNFAQRAEAIKALLNQEHPTIIGIQEGGTGEPEQCHPADIESRTERIKNFLGEDKYAVTSADSGNADNGIVYDKDRLTLLSSEEHKLKGWNSNTKKLEEGKITAWQARFLDKKTKKEFIVLNTHPAYHAGAPGEYARQEAAKILRDIVEAADVPVIATGDYNAAEDSMIHKLIVDYGPLDDSWQIVEAENKKSGEVTTWPNFNKDIAKETSKYRIDWILVSPGVKVLAAGMNTFTLNGQFPTDHVPYQALILLPETEAETPKASLDEHAGWSMKNGKFIFMVKNGEPFTGWMSLIGTKRGQWVELPSDSKGLVHFYFDNTGTMATGWQTIAGQQRYFVPESGVLTGWSKIGSEWFYFDVSNPSDFTNAEKLTGWRYLSYGGSADWYYFDLKTGAMATGWRFIGNKWYYLRNCDYYKKIDGKEKLIKGDFLGPMLTGWQLLKWSKGKLSETHDKDWFYFADSGAMVTGWQKLKWRGVENWYYFDPTNGNMVYGWKQIGGKWYYFQNGSYYKEINGKLVYALHNPEIYHGPMLTGWQYLDWKGKKDWYYFDPASGAMLANAVKDKEGVTYRCAASGACTPVTN